LKLTEEEFYNYWLKKYHDITKWEVIKQEPEICKTQEWYKKYAVTQDQHDEWYEWAINRIMKHHRCSRKYAMQLFAFDYINIAPYVKAL